MSAGEAPDTGFKLHGLIKDVLAESEETDVDQLALEVLSRIKKYDRETALYQALRQMVRTAFRPAFIPAQPREHADAAASFGGSTPVPEDRDGRQWLDDDGSLRETAKTAAKTKRAPQPPKTSSKVVAIREAWQQSLMQRIAIGGGKQKFLGDCSIADLEFAAAQREEHARRTQARAAELHRLIGLMREHDAMKLSDLPAEVLAENLSDAA